MKRDNIQRGHGRETSINKGTKTYAVLTNQCQWLRVNSGESRIVCPINLVPGVAKSQTVLSNFHFHRFTFMKKWKWQLLSGQLFPSPGDLPNPGINPGLLHCKWILYQLSHKRSPRILEWVAVTFPRGFPNPGIEPRSLALQADSLPSELPGKPIVLIS